MYSGLHDVMRLIFNFIFPSSAQIKWHDIYDNASVMGFSEYFAFADNAI